MKLDFSSGFLSAVCTILGAVSFLTAAPDPNFHIYIAYGQSNMAGAGEIRKGIDDVEHPRYKMYATTACTQLGRPNVGALYPAIPPMFHCGEGLSIADWFGRYMADSLPGVTVAVIPVAVGGTKIELFDKDKYAEYLAGEASWLVNWAKDYGTDGNAHARIVEVAKKAMQDGVIKGFIFHQGESGAMSGNDWQSEVKKTRDDILNALNLSADTVPFLAGEMEDSDAGGCCYGFALNQVGNLPNIMENTYVVKSTGLKGNGKDSYHFSSESYQEFGLRYAQKMLEVMHKTTAVVPQEPFGGKRVTLPGRIEAENYDLGGQNKAYYDSDLKNEGGKYRDDGVDIDTIPAGGYAVGYTRKGEWLKYSVEAPLAGDFEVSVHVATGSTAAGFAVFVDERILGDSVPVEKTGEDWSSYQMVSVGKLTLPAGNHEIKLLVTGDYVNIDYLDFSLCVDSTTAIRSGRQIHEQAKDKRLRFDGQKVYLQKNGKKFDLLGIQIK